MKTMMKSVDMLAWFDSDGNPHPIRFRVQNQQDENIIIKIDHISNTEMERHAGNDMIRFDCRATMKSSCRNVQLKYEMGSCKWFLSKI